MNSTTKILIALGLAAVLAVVIFLFLAPPASAPVSEEKHDSNSGSEPIENEGTSNDGVSENEDTTDTKPEEDGITPDAEPRAETYSMSQVAAHSSPEDCWTVIRGDVYNLTAWISKHPGGNQAIEQLCGRDGTAEFTGQHGGQNRQENLLTSFKVGVVSQ